MTKPPVSQRIVDAHVDESGTYAVDAPSPEAQWDGIVAAVPQLLGRMTLRQRAACFAFVTALLEETRP